MNAYSRAAAVMLLAACGAVLMAGCATQPVRTDALEGSCALAPPSTIAALVEEGQRTLSAPACRGRFDEYLQLALARAESMPAEVNRQRFADFMHGAVQQGLVSEYAARQAFNRYFHTTFVSLPADYNLCSTLRNKGALLAALATELEDKRRGLLTISADRAGFQEAQRQYTDLQLILEATALACADGQA